MKWSTRAGEVAPWTLRRWQTKALDRVLDLLDHPNPTPVVVQAIMGAGKSVLIAEVVVSVELDPDEVIIITAPTQRLVEQLAATLRIRLGEFSVGRYYAQVKEPDKAVICCCMDSAPKLAALLQEQKRQCALWVADEAHRTESDTAHEAHRLLQPQHALGLTATPYLDDDAQALSLWRELAYQYGPSEALRDGVVVPWRVVPWTGGETDVDTACVALMLDNADGPGVVNAVSIADATDYAERLTVAGLPTEAVHSRRRPNENTDAIQRLRTGELGCLVHCNMLAEGVDFPWLRWLCLRRPVSSRVRFAQEVGRALRAAPGKREAVILDPMDLFGSFSLSYEAVLWDQGADRSATEDAVQDVARTARQLRLDIDIPGKVGVDKRAAMLSAVAAYLRQLSLAMQAAGLSDQPQIRSSSWRRDEPSPKQIATVQRMQWARQALGKQMPELHYNALKLAATAAGKGHLNKGQVSDLLDILFTLARQRRWPDQEIVDRMVGTEAA